ncbi:polysaccharide deacetylase family protein [Bacillus aerolatus]|uniref:Polysaccharide deacetylase family protein n=1 Tax=Bacillus aerolatus TaxID=2653354 RepID=A0A6I1FIZ6_9BACI|nr:polysaccharide deacetylase family protein [Bacillus aerolatus]
MKHMISIVVIVVIMLFFVESKAVNSYLDQLKNKAEFVHKGVQPLLHEIKQEAKDRRVRPQNAKVDPVWKAVPGYNGLEVDVKKSYKSMKKDGIFNESRLIYKQVPPAVQLKDLPPEPIYGGHPEKPMVSFAINVAWGEEYLPKMLEVLKKHSIHATFFFEGRWVKKHPDLAKVILNAGHEGGNHSYTHPDMAVISAERAKEEMEKTNDVIEAATGTRPVLFAPPSGSFTGDTVKVAHRLGMRTTLWTVDTIDWRKPSPDVLINRVISRVHPGAIILMHPTEASSASLNTLIIEIKAKQLKLDTVSNLLSETRIISHKTTSH